MLDILVPSRRNAVAAKKFFRRLLKGLRYVPRVIVTDKLASYQVAHRELVLVPSVQHRRSKYLNNRAENSHQPTRQRERAMKRFKSIRHAQRFLSAFSGISPHFRPRRHLLSAADYRQVMADRFAVWERDHRGDDHGRRLNRRLGQDVSSKPRLITPNHHIGQLGWLKLTVPANVMLVDGGLVKVLDFGIAMLRGAGALPRLTQVDRTVGTPAYMSPEQCLGQAVTSASDIYSPPVG